MAFRGLGSCLIDTPAGNQDTASGQPTIRTAAGFQLECFRLCNGASAMAISREQARTEHTSSTSHDQFSETIYGVVCSTCHNYILIDKTNCPASCREHETCRAAYA
jgi:hypothetical protein